MYHYFKNQFALWSECDDVIENTLTTQGNEALFPGHWSTSGSVDTGPGEHTIGKAKSSPERMKQNLCKIISNRNEGRMGKIIMLRHL